MLFRHFLLKDTKYLLRCPHYVDGKQYKEMNSTRCLNEGKHFDNAIKSTYVM